MAFNLQITNKNLVASNLPILEKQAVCHFAADVAAGSSTITVDNITGFSVGKFVLLGNFGEANAEIIRIHTVTAPSGSTITLNSVTLFDHYTDTPVTLLEYDQIEFSRATTLAGAKTVLTTKAISADSTVTTYTDLVNTTGFGFYRFKNSATAFFSDYSGGVNYLGNQYKSFEAIAEEACSMAAVEIGSQYATEKALLSDANEAQDYIAQSQDWSFELIKDDTSITTTPNENKYSLSALTYPIKYPGTYQGILSVKFGNQPLDYLSIDEMEDVFAHSAETTLAANANIADTSITLTDSNEFADQGTVYLGENLVTYTANNKTTGVLSGISAADITVAVSAGATVWQNVSPTIPTAYTIFNNQIILNAPVETDSAGVKLKIKYLKILDRLTDFSSVLEVPFYNAVHEFVASKIEQRKRNFDEAKRHAGDADDIIKMNQDIYKLPTLEEETYYNFRTIEDAWLTNTRRRLL